MRKVFAAAALAVTVSAATLALAQTKPLNEYGQYDPPQNQAMTTVSPPALDARSMASDREVGEARRAYRAACDAYQSTAYCECVTAGVAQALLPAEVRMAASTIGERINAQGDGYPAVSSDNTAALESSEARIEQVEAHYADACVQYRR